MQLIIMTFAWMGIIAIFAIVLVLLLTYLGWVAIPACIGGYCLIRLMESPPPRRYRD